MPAAIKPSAFSPATCPWLEEKPGGVVLRLHVQPKASVTGIAGPRGEPPRLKIRVAAPPVDGAANEELAVFLGRLLRIPKSSVRVVRGQTGRAKDVFCAGVDARIALTVIGGFIK